MKLFERALTLLFVAFTTVSLSFSDAPPPRNLHGTFHDNLVSLQWNRPESITPPLFYRLFRNTGDHWPSVIATTSDTSKDDNSVVLNTEYHYFVTAVYHDSISSGPSNFIEVFTGVDTLEDSNQVQITFTSDPVRSGTIGQPYTYDANVSTNPTGIKVCFHLEEAPNGMTINDSTGVVDWTPASGGVFEVKIRARACNGSEEGAEQEYRISVFSGPPGSVTGFVQNDSGAGLAHVIIKLFDVSLDESVLSTHTDSTGHYAFPTVNPATYFVRARPENELYAPQWYNGVSELHDATPVVVPQSTTVTVNFTLHRRDTTEDHFTLSGSVSDSASNPIKGARVFFFRSGWDDSEGDDYGEEHDSEHGTQTDSNGHYSAILRAGTYVVGAFAEGFLPQFWDHKGTPLEADRIHLASDTTGIDFNLHHRATGTGSIAGFIRNAADNSGVKSHVVGFQKDGSGHFTGFVAATRSDTSGHYTLSHLPDGPYIVLASSEDDFAPTFYNTTGGTPFLDSATAVSVSGTLVDGINIFVNEDSSEGLNSIAGMITSAPAVGGTGTMVPLSGAIVTVTTGTHMPVGSAISQSDGSYLVPGLAPGAYSVAFQKPGMSSASVPATVNYSNNQPTTVTINAQLSNSAGGSGQIGVMSVQARWNLVSLPVSVQDAHRTAVFPGASSPAFHFDGNMGYTISDVLDYRAGYWMRFPAPQAFSIMGAQRTQQTITLTAGWNLIGSLSTPVGVSTITTTPAGILKSNFFTYNQGYTTTISIDPGRGYWVKSSAAGSLNLNAGAAAPKAAPNAVSALSALNTLRVKDAAGNAQTLYFGPDTKTIDASAYQVPPPPPAEAFDVRFASQRLVELHPSSVGHAQNFAIALQSALQPLTISWSVQNAGAQYLLKDRTGTIVARLSGKGSTQVQSSTAGFVLGVQSLEIPKAYALHQNYPNPFNPTTTIGFDLPVAATVSLKVFNILGQEVARVVDAQPFEAGAQSISFDANKLPSGIYFYHLQAGSFSDVKKMVLMR
jgi:fibronectin type 3 domain-containing protein